MQILPINSVDFNRNNFIKKNKPENENNLTFKTAAYRRVMAEAMEACCVSHEKEVISLFDRLLKAAVNMKDVVKVGESPIFHTRYSLMERLRMKAQISDEEKCRRSDYIIHNDGSLSLENQLSALSGQLKKRK